MNCKLLTLSLIFLIFLLPFVNGITGSIGNAKAIVNVNLKESNVLERTVFVQNINNVSININLEATDDLEGITEIIDKEFTLGPNEEKNARFKVKIPKEGTYNGNIAVFFKPSEGRGAGVVLQSNLIIRASGDNPSITDNSDNTDVDDNVVNNSDSNTDNQITGSTVKESNEDLSLGLVFFIVLIGIIVISVLIFLMRRI